MGNSCARIRPQDDASRMEHHGRFDDWRQRWADAEGQYYREPYRSAFFHGYNGLPIDVLLNEYASRGDLFGRIVSAHSHGAEIRFRQQMVTISAKLPRELYTALRDDAEASGRFVGVVLAQAIQEYLERNS